MNLQLMKNTRWQCIFLMVVSICILAVWVGQTSFAASNTCIKIDLKPSHFVRYEHVKLVQQGSNIVLQGRIGLRSFSSLSNTGQLVWTVQQKNGPKFEGVVEQSLKILENRRVPMSSTFYIPLPEGIECGSQVVIDFLPAS